MKPKKPSAGKEGGEPVKPILTESKDNAAEGSPIVNDDAAADAAVAAREKMAKPSEGSVEIPVNRAEIAEPSVVQYSIRERGNPDEPAVVVESPDGTIEDAVRAFNARRKEVRTAKQLLITKV